MQAFVVRLWVPGDDETTETEALRGIIERVGSGSSTPFRGGEELLALLRAGLAAGADDPRERREAT